MDATARFDTQIVGALCVVIVKHRGTVSRRLTESSDIQRTLLGLLDISAEHLRAYRQGLQHQNLGCGT